MTKRSHEDEKLPLKGHKDSDEKEYKNGAKKPAFQSDQQIKEKKSHIGDKDGKKGVGGASVKSGNQGKDGECDDWEGKRGQPAVELEQHLKTHQDLKAQGSRGGKGSKGGNRGTSVKSGHDGEDGGPDGRGGKGGQPAVERDQDQGGVQPEVILKPQGSRGGKGGQGGKGGIFTKSGNAGQDGSSDGRGGKGGPPAISSNRDLQNDKNGKVKSCILT